MARTGAMVLGIIGGIFGILVGIFVVLVGGVGGALGVAGAKTVVGQGLGAIILAIIGLIGGAIVKGKPKLAGWMMILSGVLGFIAVSVFWFISGILLIVGGILALRSRDV